MNQLQLVAGLSLCALLGAAGCNSDNGSSTPTATSSVTRSTTPTITPTATPPPTATPTEEEPPHTENLFGSTEPGGGALTVHAAPDVDVPFSVCIGGTGDNCTGGIAIYVATDPGFKEADEDEPAEPLYTLLDGIPITLEVTAIDPDVSLIFGDVTLTAPGQTVSLGSTPGIHADLEWQLALPGGDLSSRSVTLKMTTTSSTYTESEEFTVTLTPSPAGQ